MTTIAIQGDATSLPLADESVDCIVTSPPYNCGMPYDGVSDVMPWGEYVELAKAASVEMERVLKPGGRLWLNCQHNMPTYDDIDKQRAGKAKLLDERADPFAIWKACLTKHLRYRDVLVWFQVGADDSAWGSWLSPNAPNVRGRWEPILLMFKGSWKRGRVGQNDVTPDDFLAMTRNVWEMGSAPRKGHPAPFPKELPRRCILLSTWPGDVVLDPFCGSGTTVKVAKDLGRVGIGVDLSPAYVEMTRDRVAQEVLAL